MFAIEIQDLNQPHYLVPSSGCEPAVHVPRGHPGTVSTATHAGGGCVGPGRHVQGRWLWLRYLGKGGRAGVWRDEEC